MWKDALVVEDDPAIVQAVGLILRTAGWSIQHAPRVGDAVHWLTRRRFAVAVVDLGLPDGSGQEVIRESQARWPGMPVLVLTIATAWPQVEAALRAGAVGYLLKEDLGRRLVPALEDLLRGGSVLSAAVARDMVRSVVGEPNSASGRGPLTGRVSVALAPADGPGLSRREQEVLAMLAFGHTYDDIGGSLGISTNTVRTHIRSLYEKLGVNNRTLAVREGQRLGLITMG